MKIIEKNIDSLTPYYNNPRNNENAVEPVAASIREFGFKIPIIIDSDGVIVAGHTRLKAAQKLGMKKVPCIVADDLTPEQIKAFRVADNKVSEFAEWDFEKLEEELSALSLDMEPFGFRSNNISGNYDGEAIPPTLKERFIMPPFSILDARKGDWQKRKKEWVKIVRSGNGRDSGMIGAWDDLAKQHDMNLTGTSIFDPVLTEILLQWFSPKGGKVLDPFAGGSVRGIVSQFLQRRYTGIDLRPEQIDENENQFDEIEQSSDFYGEKINRPNWIVGDSREIDTIVKDNDFDFILSCPPYADLEVYSDDPKDLSTMKYEDFKAAYFEIIKKSVEKLKPDAFAAFVVGEVRDKKGAYRNFIGDTIQAFEAAGMKYYNEIILITAAGTLPVRAGTQFEATRKVGNTHQKALIFFQTRNDESFKDMIETFDRTRTIVEMKKSVLVFLRGDAKNAKSNIKNYDFDPF